MGTQEPVESITEVGAAFWYGFALGDLLSYLPILLAGLIGHMLHRNWGRIIFAASLGISVYWPIVCLVTISDAHNDDFGVGAKRLGGFEKHRSLYCPLSAA